jgi:hypothetical protein
MHKMFVLAAVALASVSAHADFNTDGISGQVTCTGNGLVVTINANRTLFRVVEQGRSEVFTITGRDSDGDTEVTRTGAFRFGATVVTATLSFDDRGDSLELGGRTFALRCPQ